MLTKLLFRALHHCLIQAIPLLPLRLGAIVDLPDHLETEPTSTVASTIGEPQA